MGAMFDWSREVITCLPEYYKWNQWFFLQFFKQGLAYRQKGAVDWCPNCNTTLAREQVIGDDRRCERCGTPVIKRDLEQWFFRITDYAEELLDFEGLEWPERVKTMQTNWIGRSEGANITFSTPSGEDIAVFTTRPDTIYGVTFMVLAPEHPLVDKLTTPDRRADVDAYIEQTHASDRDRAHGGGQDEDRRLHRRLLHQPLQRRARAGLDRRLRAGRLRHRRRHGRAGARRARLRVRPEVRPRRSGRHRAARTTTARR